MSTLISDSVCTLERELKQEQEEEEQEQKQEGEEEEEEDDDDVGNKEEEEEEQRRRQTGQTPNLPVVFRHRQELLHLLEKLLSFHQWKDAAGVISQVFRCSPPRTISERQLRRLFMAACEIEKRLGDGANDFRKGIRQIFEGYIEQLLSPEMIASAKLELAKFYLSQGEYEDAYQNATNTQITLRGNLAQVKDGRGNPFVNLTLGMICYKRWYKHVIPEDMKLQSYDESGTRGMYQSDVEAGSTSPTSHTNLKDLSAILSHGLDLCLFPVRLRPAQEDLEYSIQELRELPKDRIYEEGVQCLKNAVHSSPPKSASLDALEPLVQLLLLGDHVAEAGAELVSACHWFNYSAVPFSLRARFLECFAPQKIVTISSCYQAALKIDPTCPSYIEGLSRIYRNKNDEHSMKVLLEMIPWHIDAMVPSRVSVGQDVGREVKTSVWEELASCFLKVSIHFQGRIMSELLSERVGRATWKTRARWWREKHFREISPSCQACSRMSEHVSVSGASNAGSELSKPQGSKWKDHYECDSNNGSASARNYCNVNVTGGMHMMKGHLIGKKRSIEACDSVPQPAKKHIKRSRKGNNREIEENTLSILSLLPGDGEILARKAACACHLYGPSDEYVVEILQVLNMNGLNDQTSFLQMHMENALNFCGLLGLR